MLMWGLLAKILARFCSSSSFFPLQPNKRSPAAGDIFLRKTGEKAWISPPFLVLEPNNLPSLLENPDLLCSSFLTAGCSCFVGANCFDFLLVSLLPKLPPAFPQPAVRFLAGNYGSQSFCQLAL
ncbi:hypothetical protein SLEP1_g15132 [Rubroshorea leprosula]|uniref:Secreted protein n=1 Tax=Rubroshorea leprosula TaxID=152421 RepID=A0AAV5IVW1_9ROSI|nr:hypothetical protein SLEP1_g15132 [Rubroshorea leprosula]